MVWWAAWSQFRTRRRTSHHRSQARRPWSGGANTSRQPYVSCTGCQSADEWISRSTLVYRSLAGTAPVYLGGECRPTLVTAAGRRPLRSADNRACLLVKRSRNQFGDRCFATAGPTLWNSLSEQLRQSDITFGQSKRSLKTFMFG